MLQYNALSDGLQQRILRDRRAGWVNPHRCPDSAARRRLSRGGDAETMWRPAYVRDVEKIMHCPFYNRYSDKTQVFSFYRNDDITRRALHVQLVSRIARNIGGLLGLNLDLIEAIALGHDIGHAPFGHAGERFLSQLYHGQTGRYFNHNVHSVRVLDGLLARNLSLQALDGILCHNGEFARQEYRPRPLGDFAGLERRMEACSRDQAQIDTLVPATLEACVVRVCDMIAYLGKDRQDAKRAKLISEDAPFTPGALGVENAQIINNLVVNLVENSYGADYLRLDDGFYDELKTAKRENNELIYRSEPIDQPYDTNIRPMFEAIYLRLLDDLRRGDQSSVIYRHHIQFIKDCRKHYQAPDFPPPYEEEEPNQIVVDYMASMTDDYFVDLYHYLFPKGRYKVEYISYFSDL